MFNSFENCVSNQRILKMVSFFQHDPWVLLVAQHDSWLVVRPGVVSRASEARTRNRLTEQLDQSVEKGGTRLSGTFKKNRLFFRDTGTTFCNNSCTSIGEKEMKVPTIDLG